jgi:hypothetical protein
MRAIKAYSGFSQPCRAIAAVSWKKSPRTFVCRVSSTITLSVWRACTLAGLGVVFDEQMELNRL